MGFAVPAAIGAKVGSPDQPVIAIDGDGCFQMTFQEIAAAVQHDIPVVFCVINNGYLGMVRQWQHLFYEDRLSEVHAAPGLPGPRQARRRVRHPGLPGDHDGRARHGPREGAGRSPTSAVLIDLRVDPDEMVFPMIPAGPVQRRDDRVGRGVATPESRRARLPGHRARSRPITDAAGPGSLTSPRGCRDATPSPCWSRTSPAC
jgi:thiamine pyrophosphate-dependent acetolactate synthase large subunit-like protein